MGRKHAAARSALAGAQADEAIRESESRIQGAERERQLLTSYLGTEEQVAGTGRFNVSPDVLRFTQRYSVDQRALADAQSAGAAVKNQGDPFLAGDNGLRGGKNLFDYSSGIANQANDLLAQAEAAARAGDLTGANQLYSQAQGIISGISANAQYAFNLGGGEDSAAAIRASSTEGRIVGRQLLTAQQLGDPNSTQTAELRGRLLDPSLAAIDENTRNAERAIASERSQIEGDIRQQAAGSGSGFNPRAQLALESRAASDAALQRATVYSQAGAQKASLLAQTNLYINEFAKRFAEDAVGLAQDWVNGTAGVRDLFQQNLLQLNLFQAELAFQREQIFFKQAEARRAESKNKPKNVRDFVFGTAGGASSEFASQGIKSLFSEDAPQQPAVGSNASSGVGAGGGGGGQDSFEAIASLGSLFASFA